MEVIIQKAEIKNLKQIQELNHQLCIKEAKEFDSTINKDFPIQKEGEKYFKDRVTKDDSIALIAIVDKKVIGYLVGSIAKLEFYRKSVKIAETENMFVLKEYRGKGIGTKLMKEFEKWADSKSVDRIRVIPSAKNKSAIDFYRKLGFFDYELTLEKKA